MTRGGVASRDRAISNVETWMTPRSGHPRPTPRSPSFRRGRCRTPATRRSSRARSPPTSLCHRRYLASRSDLPLGSGSSTPTTKHRCRARRRRGGSTSPCATPSETTFALAPVGPQGDDGHRLRVVRLVNRAHREPPRRTRPRRRPRPRRGACVHLESPASAAARGARCSPDRARRGARTMPGCSCGAISSLATSAGALTGRGLGRGLGRGFLAGDEVSDTRAAAVQSTKGARRIGRSFRTRARARCKVFLGRDVIAPAECWLSSRGTR